MFMYWGPLVIGAVCVVLSIVAIVKIPQRKVYRAAIVDGMAYWQDAGNWWKAPAFDGSIHADEKEMIDIFTADEEEVHLLMKIVERFES